MVEDRIDWNQDGQGLHSPGGYTHIFVVDAILGGTPTQLTSDKYNHNSPAWVARREAPFTSAPSASRTPPT